MQENSKMVLSLWLLCGEWALRVCGHCVIQDRNDNLSLYKKCGKSPPATLQYIIVNFSSVCKLYLIGFPISVILQNWITYVPKKFADYDKFNTINILFFFLETASGMTLQNIYNLYTNAFGQVEIPWNSEFIIKCIIVSKQYWMVRELYYLSLPFRLLPENYLSLVVISTDSSPINSQLIFAQIAIEIYKNFINYFF